MRRVIVESPYAGDTARHLAYARACLLDCLKRGETPFASHLLYTQMGVLDDRDPVQRALGLNAGWAWYAGAQACVSYEDLGLSSGMVAGIAKARALRLPIERRRLGRTWGSK